MLFKKGPQDYWILGTCTKPLPAAKGKEKVELEGYNTPLTPTKDPRQFLAPGGLLGNKGGYHAWQSRDMVTWVYHGPVTSEKGRWTTTAEFKDGKAYIYCDFPNDQDPHLVIDSDLTDGKPGDGKGMVFKDPSDGYDTAIIRDLDGKFHIIYEDWSPLNASKRAWDSPLAGHSVSPDGQNDFKILDPAVDLRTTPTGKFGTYFHPHWHKDDPANYPRVDVLDNSFGHGLKKGMKAAQETYEIHEPAQAAYGDGLPFL